MLNDVTNNIYKSWYETIKNKGRGASLKPVKGLDSFTKVDLHHLIWLLHEELKGRPENE